MLQLHLAFCSPSCSRMDFFPFGVFNLDDQIGAVSLIFEDHAFGIRIAVFLIVLSCLVYWIGIYPLHILQKYGIPHPKATLFLGNLKEIAANGGMNKLHMLGIKEPGKVYGYYVGRRPIIVVADPEMLEQIFIKEFSNFHNRPRLLGKGKKPMDMGLVLANYSDWRRIRSTISPTFSAGKIKQVMPLVEKSIDTLANILSDSAKKGESVDIFRIYGYMAMEVIMSVAFGLENDFQLNVDQTVMDECFRWFNPPSGTFFADMMPLPLFMKDFIKQQFLQDPAFLLSLIEPVVEARKKRPSKRRDFLQLLLSENKVDGKQKLTDDDIHASAITFLLAGYETTSNALSYTTYLLAMHPEIQERLYQEVKGVMEGREDTSIYEEIQKMEYLDAVLNESLRVYPPVWVTARMIKEECTIGKCKLPGGVGLQIPIYAIHHCEEFWKEPYKFDPERFSQENKGGINPYHFMPFGHGPRNCVGMRFALVEAKTTLVKLIHRFKFERTEETESHPLDLRFGVTISPMKEVKLKFVER